MRAGTYLHNETDSVSEGVSGEIGEIVDYLAYTRSPLLLAVLALLFRPQLLEAVWVREAAKNQNVIYYRYRTGDDLADVRSALANRIHQRVLSMNLEPKDPDSFILVVTIYGSHSGDNPATPVDSVDELALYERNPLSHHHFLFRRYRDWMIGSGRRQLSALLNRIELTDEQPIVVVWVGYEAEARRNIRARLGILRWTFPASWDYLI